MTRVAAFMKREARAFRHSFHYHEGNSNPLKTVFYVSLAVAGVIVLGQAFGFVNYDALAPPVKILLDSSVGVAVYLFGRVHGKESALLSSDGAPAPSGAASVNVPVQGHEDAQPPAQVPNQEGK